MQNGQPFLAGKGGLDLRHQHFRPKRLKKVITPFRNHGNVKSNRELKSPSTLFKFFLPIYFLFFPPQANSLEVRQR